MLTVKGGVDPHMRWIKLVASTFVHDDDAYVNLWVAINLHLLVN
jgi:hypothetical protein